MNYQSKQDIIHRLHEHAIIAEEYGDVFGVFLIGSQNYSNKLDNPSSDIDTRAIIVPSFESFCLNRQPTSTNRKLSNHEFVDVKDIREFTRLLLKSNINTIEVLFTKYFIINPKYQEFYNQLIQMREYIARYDQTRMLNSSKGMIFSYHKKFKESLGDQTYNGKTLANMIRIKELNKAYIDGLNFEVCLTISDDEYLRKVRSGNYYTALEAKKLANDTIKELEADHKQYMLFDLPKDKAIEDKLKQYLLELFAEQFKDVVCK